MLDATNIKSILKLAGINHLEIAIYEKLKTVKFTYIFRGKTGVKEFTFQEIKDAFEIKRSQFPGNDKPAQKWPTEQPASRQLDPGQELK